MPWGAAASAVGGIATGLLSGGASQKAADQQRQAAQQALQFQQGVYGQGQSNLQPFINSGNSALSSLMGLLGLGGQGQNATAQSAFQQFTQNPSYQFPLQQGNLALNRQLASAGLTSSGGALKDAIGYNQGFASQGLNSYLAQLAGIAGQGQGAATSLLGFGNNAAAGVANAQAGIGNAGAAGIQGGAKGLNQAISGGIGPLVGQNNGGVGGPNSPVGQFGSWLSGLFTQPNNGGSSYTPLAPAQNPDLNGAYPAGGLT